MMLVFDRRSYMTSKYDKLFFYYNSLSDEKTVKFTLMDRLISASKTNNLEYVPITLVDIPYSSLICLGIIIVTGSCSCWSVN